MRRTIGMINVHGLPYPPKSHGQALDGTICKCGAGTPILVATFDRNDDTGS
jgi:hypothetical protein